MRRQQSDGGRQLNFEFPDDDETGPQKGTRENATARTPELWKAVEKRSRSAELKQPGTERKKDRRHCRKRLQVDWNTERIAGQRAQKRGGGNKERRCELRKALQPAAGEEEAATWVGAIPRPQCGRVLCSMKRVICRDLRAEVLAQQCEIERLQRIVQDGQRRLEDKEGEMRKERQELLASGVAQSEAHRKWEEGIRRQMQKQLFAEEQLGEAVQGRGNLNGSGHLDRAVVDWEQRLMSQSQSRWEIRCGGSGEGPISVPYQCAKEICMQLAEADREWELAVGGWAEVKGAVIVLERQVGRLERQVVELKSDAEVAKAAVRAEMADEKPQADKSRAAWEAAIERDRTEVANAWQIVEQIRRQKLFVACNTEVGSSGLQLLLAEVNKQEFMRCKLVGDAWRHFNVVAEAPFQYYGVEQGRRQRKNTDRRAIELRRECRGMVVSGDGVVKIRPVQKFYRMWQLSGVEKAALDCVKVQTVTEKLDGEMMCGVVMEGQVELWSRGGWTPQARSATRWASSKGVGVLTMVAEVWERGGTATFEYLGRQSRVKVRYAETDLVLLAVRDRESGVWWDHTELERLGEHHGVAVVRRLFELEVLGLHEIESEVSKWTGVEGVIIRMVDGMVLKAKSLWWRRGESKEKRRWHSLEAKQQARKRRAKRRYHMETESQRVVLRGWNHWVHPSRVFSEMASAEKVEAIYRRSDGRQGTVVVSFGTAEAAKAVIEQGCRRVYGSRVSAVRAYSARVTPTEEHRVKTWWRQGRV